MVDYLPRELQEGLAAARLSRARDRARLRVQLGDELYPILRFWDQGFALDARGVPSLRGLVDVFDGSRHVLQCLIIASEIEGDELICEYKWARKASDQAPADFVPETPRPAGLLPRL